jgi:subfamily B ATP-binding cassette protein MsbA
MIIGTLMDVAAPWPLKIVIDNVIGQQPLPQWLSWIKIFSISESKTALAAAAAITLVVLTVIGAVAGYVS